MLICLPSCEDISDLVYSTRRGALYLMIDAEEWPWARCEAIRLGQCALMRRRFHSAMKPPGSALIRHLSLQGRDTGADSTSETGGGIDPAGGPRRRWGLALR